MRGVLVLMACGAIAAAHRAALTVAVVPPSAAPESNTDSALGDLLARAAKTVRQWGSKPVVVSASGESAAPTGLLCRALVRL